MTDLEILEKGLKEDVERLKKQKDNPGDDANMFTSCIIDVQIMSFNDVLKMIESLRRMNNE